MTHAAPSIAVMDVPNPGKHEKRSDWSQRFGSRELAPLTTRDNKDAPGLREWIHETGRRTGAVPDIISAARALRDDPLARLHHHHQVSEAQYHAGRRWQGLYEDSQVGRMGSSGDLKEPVDGSRRIAEPLSDKQRKAAKRLLQLDAILGEVGSLLVRDVLAGGLNFKLVAEKHGGAGSRPYEEWIGKRFRECLTTLAKELGYG